MTDIAIRVEHLSKLYHIGKLQHRHDTLREALAGSFKRADAQGTDDLLWALRDISFDVRRGEVIGIIGRNGAGKSTLLKILSRITEPTEGRAEIHGRVGSLLEVGTGFHPELTGRENIFLNGAILGMHRAEITRKFDEIVAFAEIEKFLDTPVKRYSSGMYVRLAFAVAAHLEPEILLVDEVLAVGDAAFQKKCLGKMGDVAKEGRTVVFVSHNMAAVRQLCGSALVLEGGKKAYVGEADDAVRVYNAGLESAGARTLGSGVTESSWACLDAVRLADARGHSAERFFWSEPVYVEVDWRTLCTGSTLRMSLFLSNTDSICVFASKQVFEGVDIGCYRATVEIPARLLNAGSYSLAVHMDRPFIETLLRMEPAARFLVEHERIEGEVFGERQAGVVKPELRWTCARRSDISTK